MKAELKPLLVKQIKASQLTPCYPAAIGKTHKKRQSKSLLSNLQSIVNWPQGATLDIIIPFLMCF
jgi:hypothetical protein